MLSGPGDPIAGLRPEQAEQRGIQGEPLANACPWTPAEGLKRTEKGTDSSGSHLLGCARPHAHLALPGKLPPSSWSVSPPGSEVKPSRPHITGKETEARVGTCSSFQGVLRWTEVGIRVCLTLSPQQTLRPDLF